MRRAPARPDRRRRARPRRSRCRSPSARTRPAWQRSSTGRSLETAATDHASTRSDVDVEARSPTVDISFTCDPLLVYDWETGTYDAPRPLDTVDGAIAADRPGARGRSIALGIRQTRPAVDVIACDGTSDVHAVTDPGRCVDGALEVGRRSSSEPRSRVDDPRADEPRRQQRSRHRQARQVRTPPSAYRESGARSRRRRRRRGARERAHPKVRERAADPPTNARPEMAPASFR